ncbi:gtp binding protein [Stemphylium lycopersici]|nr:gtp binding protein [Stemphylium lycopersici]
MPLSNEELGEYIASLERLLQGNPAGQTAALTGYVHKLEAFSRSGDQVPIEKTLQLFGTAVGGRKRWQAPFRDSGILAYALRGLSTVRHEDPIAKQYLRVVGNSVADNDPAKAAAATLRLDATITTFLVLDRIPEAALDYATDLLSWTTSNLNDAQFKDEVSLETFKSLLNVALQYDEDHHLEYVAILVHYLQDPDFQQRIATPKLLDDLVTLMLEFEARLEPDEVEAVFLELATSKNADSTTSDEAEVLLMAQLIGLLSAASATDVFARSFNIRSPVIERLEAKLRAPWESAHPSTICACVMVGNLAMSDEVCIDMVKIMELHVRLITILKKSDKPALLYAAAGFMRHLTFPEANRALLADAGLMEACCRMLVLDDPSVRGEAAAMLCKLVTGNFHNIEKVMYETVGSDTEAADPEISSDTVIFSHIVEQALAPVKPLPSTTMKNPMIELGRTIVAMFRYLGRPNAEKDVEAVQLQILQVPQIARPIAQLVRQRFYPEARSEGLLGLGLLAQTLEGAAAIAEEIKEDSALLETIKEHANATEAGLAQQAPSTASRDHQNAIVLLQALQNNAVRELQEAVGEVLRTSRLTKWTQYSRIRQSLSKHQRDNSIRRSSGDVSVLSSPSRDSPGTPGRVKAELARRMTDTPKVTPGRVRGSTYIGESTGSRPSTPVRVREAIGEIEEISPGTIKETPTTERLKGKGMKRSNTAPVS